MIQPHELRIGNKLLYLTSEGDKVETTIDWQDLKWIFEDVKGFNNVHFLIKLNQSILLKLGFIRKPWGLEKDNFLFKCNGNNFNKLVMRIGGGVNVKINSLHQLQNIYYDLTNKQLIQ